MIKNETKEELKKEYLKKTPYPAPLELELPPLTSTLTLHRAIKEAKAAEVALGSKRICSVQARLGNWWDWEELEKKKKKILERIKESNKAITGDKASEVRFIERIKDGLEDKLILEEQIKKSKLEMIEYKKVIDEMQPFVDQYSVYEKFLECVAQNGREYNSVGDILNRYETLEHTRKDCAKLLENELNGASALRQEMVRLVEEKTTELKKLENLLVELRFRHRTAKEERCHLERCVRRIHAMVATEGNERVELVGGCWDMYRQMCKRRGLPATLTLNETEAQLDFIQKTVLFYKEVYTIATAAKQARES